MAEPEFKEVTPGIWKPEKEGDSIVGVYLKTEGTRDSSSKHYLDVAERGTTMIWGSTILDDKLSFVNAGKLVRITYGGKTKNKKNQDVNLYKVEVAA